MDKYELWLDESGDFSPENEKNPDKHPSLVGGVLVSAGSIADREITRLLGQNDPAGFAHAMDMGKQEMAGCVLPALEELHRQGAKLVYFENAERLDKKTPCRIDGTCHDCHGREGICRALTVLWGPMNGMETEIVLIDGDWGL